MSDQINQLSPNKKLDLLNFIKLLIILPGVTYHVSEYINFPEPLIENHWFVNIFTTYARIFYYTAFIATLSVFYPFGMNLSKKIFSLKRSIIAISGLFFLTYVYYDTESPFLNSEWTFYHFVLTSFLFLNFLLPKLKNPITNLFVLFSSFVLLLIPFWSFEASYLSKAMKIALIGDCKYSAYGEWPVLPWIFLCSAAVSFCVLLENNLRFKKITFQETFLWFLVIIPLGFLYWGDYFDQPTDLNFSCAVFTRPQLVFIAHILPYFFLIRLNYVSKIRLYLEQNQFLIFLRGISWINNFGSSYLLSLLTMGGLSLIYNGDDFTGETKHIMFMTSIFISVIVPELFLRALKKLKN